MNLSRPDFLCQDSMWSFTIISPVVGGFHLEKISNKLKFGTVIKIFVLNHQEIPKIHNGCQHLWAEKSMSPNIGILCIIL